MCQFFTENSFHVFRKFDSNREIYARKTLPPACLHFHEIFFESNLQKFLYLLALYPGLITLKNNGSLGTRLIKRGLPGIVWTDRDAFFLPSGQAPTTGQPCSQVTSHRQWSLVRHSPYVETGINAYLKYKHTIHYLWYYVQYGEVALYQPMTHICVMSSHKPIRIYMGVSKAQTRVYYALLGFNTRR